MIQGQKVIAFTPVGRKRYMDLLTAHVRRQHELGHIDEWIMFNNAYLPEDATYCRQVQQALGDWITIFTDQGIHPMHGNTNFTHSRPECISHFYQYMTQKENVIYFRLDDDVVYIDDQCVPRLVDFRLKNPEPFLVFPTIINNVRTSYHMQREGVIPNWDIRNEMCDDVAWKSPEYIHFLHQKALAALEKPGRDLSEFTLKSQVYTDDTWEDGHISINSFAIFGKDMLDCVVHKDEESYLSVWRPKELNRQNARCGDAFVIHFAYHTQTDFMDKSGMLNDYVKLAPPLGFRTHKESPPKFERGVAPPGGPLRRINVMRGHPIQRIGVRPRGVGAPSIKA